MKEEPKPKLLVVDDDRRVLKSLKIWFANEGFHPLLAVNGNEALKMAIDNTIDVALVDFRIGKEDGVSIAKQLKEVDEDLKVIILTGFPSYETAVQAMKIGVFDYLSKGSPNEKIMNAVRKALAERQSQRTRKEKDTNGERRTKLILFCNHSLIKERVENFLKESQEFKLIMSFPSVAAFRVKNLSQEIHIAMLCATCNLKNFKEAYSIFPELYRTMPGIKTLIINESFSDREKVELLKLGIRGFFPQDSSCDILGKALRHITKGDLWISRHVSYLSLKDVLQKEPQLPLNKNKIYGLTEREIEILRKITQGLKNKQIASQLEISEKTVKTHVNRILKKLGVDNRTKAVLAAMERKII
ncbi:MAG: response regulator [Candidatus Aminicenantes bacterium]|nr:MAG: response regulator [Candidatus Aminicenantes bacterium]